MKTQVWVSVGPIDTSSGVGALDENVKVLGRLGRNVRDLDFSN
jgi:hypothetical protein